MSLTSVPLIVSEPVTSVDLPVAVLSTSPDAKVPLIRYCTKVWSPLVAVIFHTPSMAPPLTTAVLASFGLGLASSRMRNQ